MKTENQVVPFDAPELSAIEPSKAEMIKKTFVPMSEMLIEFEDQFNGIITASKEGIDKQLQAKAKRLRLDYSKVRTETEKVRKARKEESLREGKAIDGVANILKWAVEDKERQLQDIEKHFENLEKERLEKLQADRVILLSPYVDDADLRDLSSMEDDVWEAYLGAKKQEHEDRIAAEKAAEKAREAEKKKKEVYDSRRDIILPMQVYREGEDVPEGMELTADISEAQFKKIKAWYESGKEAYLQRQAENERVAREAQEKANRIEKRSLEMSPYMSVIENFSDMLDMEEGKYKEFLDDAAVRMNEQKAITLTYDKHGDRTYMPGPLTTKEDMDSLSKEDPARPDTSLPADSPSDIDFLLTDEEKWKALRDDLDALKTKYEFEDSVFTKKSRGVGELIDKITTWMDEK